MQIGKKVGIMGGTFNPIHMGHLILAENAREAFQLDEVLFIPSGVPYMKKDVLDSKFRISMVELAIEDNHFFSLSKIEVEKAGYSYSYETIATLKEKNPNHIYYFIVGADALFSMEKWKCPERIFKECIILVATRDNYDDVSLKKQRDYLNAKFNGNIFLIPTRNIELSSTDIRNRVIHNQSIRYMVPENVFDFIKNKKLYINESMKEDK